MPPFPTRSQYKRVTLGHMHNTILKVVEVIADGIKEHAYSLIFLDEPTSGLEATSSLELLNHLHRVAGQSSSPYISLAWRSSICSIRYCFSVKEKASCLNKYTIEGIGAERQLLFKGKPVMTVAQKDALCLLYLYITKIGGRNSLLISHNCKGFLARFIVDKFKKYLNIKPKRLDAKGVRFADPLKILRQRRRKLFPEGIPNLKLPTVHRHLFPKRKPYFTPNAIVMIPGPSGRS